MGGGKGGRLNMFLSTVPRMRCFSLEVSSSSTSRRSYFRFSLYLVERSLQVGAREPGLKYKPRRIRETTGEFAYLLRV